MRSVARIPGLLYADPEGVRLAVREEGSLRDPAAAARVLLADDIGGLPGLAASLGAAEIVEVDVPRLSKWSFHLGQLERSHDLGKLIDEGVRSLRRYRDRDLAAEFRRSRSLIERYGAVVRALPAAAPFLSGDSASPTVERCWEALPVRLFAVADWPIDPLDHLRLHLARNDGLPAAVRAGSDPLLATLHAVLLAQRDRAAHSAAAGPPYPARQLLAAYEAAAAAPTYSPILLARALAVETSIPTLPGVRNRDLSLLARTAERVALVAGTPTALAALAHLAQPYAARAATARRRVVHLDRFLRLCAGDRLRRVNREQRAIRKRIAKLPADRRLRARALVQAFLAWIRPGEKRPVSRRRLLRAALACESSSLAAMGREICALWKASSAAAKSIVGTAPSASQTAELRRPGQRAQTLRLAISMLHPELEGSFSDPPSRKQFDLLIAALAALSAAGARALGAELVAMAEEDRLRPEVVNLVASSLPPEMVRRALAADVPRGAAKFVDSVREAGRYLDSVELLRSLDEPPAWLQEDWFLRLFGAGRAWSSALILALVAHSKSRDDPTSSGALFAISQALAREDEDLAAALDAWATVRVEHPPPELEPLAEVLGLERTELEGYLHHRRLSGRRETFSSTVLAPLRSEENRRRQIAFLEAGRSASELPRERVESTLRQLSDDRRAAGRNRARIRRARNNLRRALAQYRHQSLDLALRGACREAATKVLGRRLPDPLPEGFQQSFHLLHSDDTELALFRAFLADLASERPLAQRPENRAWLERAAAAGVDTSAWLEGLRFSCEIEGQTLTFETEKNPLHALRMGSYFNTCLTLEGGFNAASTLTNALDVNKQVIFGRRSDGAVIARKLIGATAAGELAGYYTYATEQQQRIRHFLNRRLRSFAARCRLHLSDSATPENLHHGFWWDDGNESWIREPSPAARLADPPLGSPGDTECGLEWNLRRAFFRRDPELLAAIVASGDSIYSEVAAHRLFRLSPQTAAAPLLARLSTWRMHRVGEILLAEGRLEWLAVAQRSHSDDLDRGEALLSALPDEPRAAARIAGLIVPSSSAEPEDEHRAPMSLALVPTPTLVELLLHCGRRNQAISYADGWEEEMAAVVAVAYLRRPPGRDRAVLCRELARTTELEDVVVTAARQVAMPELAPWLRKSLSAAPLTRCEALALALGRIGDRNDAGRLLAALRRGPGALGVAVAVARCGQGDSAREIWQPPADLLSVAEDPSWLELARELGAAKIGRRLRRDLTRASRPYDGTRVKRLLGLLGTIGLPGFSPRQMAAELGSSWNPRMRNRADEAQTRWQELTARHASRPEDLPEAPRPAGPPDRTTLHLALARAADRRDEKPPAVLAYLLTLPPSSVDPSFCRQVVALARPWMKSLPVGSRRGAARLARRDLHGGFSLCAGKTLRRWLGALPIDQRARSFVRSCWVGWRAAAPGLIHLLLLLDEDPELRDRAIELYPQEFPGPASSLLFLMELALQWLEPDVAETFTEGICARIDPQTLTREDFQGLWADAHDEAGYRFHQLVIRYLLPDLPAEERRALLEQAEAAGTRRGRWLAESFGAL